MIEIQCRTCLVITDLESSSHIAQKRLLGRTLKEIILLFVPEMVASPLIGEIICLNCYEILCTFAKFIERCIEVESILKRIRKDVEGCIRTKCIVTNNKANKDLTPQVTLKGSIQKEDKMQSVLKQDHQYHQPRLSFNRKKIIRMDSHQDTSGNGSVEINNVDIKGSEEVEHQSLLNTSNFTQTLSSDSDSDVIFEDEFTEQFVESSKKQQGMGDTTERQKVCDSCSIPLPSSFLDTATKCKNCLPLEKEINEPTVAIALHDDGLAAENCTIETASSSTKIYANEILHFDEDEEASFDVVGSKNAVSVIQLESLDNYLMCAHNRVISTPQPTEVLPKFINNLSTNGIEVFCYGSFANMENKRVLLFGTHMIRCPVCGTSFKNRRSFTLHFSTIHIDCNLPEPEKDVFDSVIRKTRARQERQCPICQKDFLTRRLLEKHLWLTHKQCVPYKCEKCGKCFRLRSKYEKHIMFSKEFDSCHYRKCSVCKEMFDKADKFTEHMKLHKDFICEKCGASFTKLSYLRMHQIKHQNQCKGDRLCPVCGKLFSSSNFNYHMKVHEGEHTKPYMCDKCPKSFSTERRVVVHKKSVHQVKKQLECPTCKEKCSTLGALRYHNRLKHSNIRSHTCHICGAQFSRGDYFRRHMRSHATSLDPNKRNTTMKKYVKTARDPVKCKYCSKLCKNVYELRTHILGHVKTVRYKCRYCNFSFSCLTNRHRHEKRHKDPNFDLSCMICWKRLNTKEELDIHYAKHNKSRKHKCDKCDELFPSKFLLGQHVSEKHINKDEVEKQKATVLQEALKEFLI